jgi:YfiH family protein
LDTPFIDIELSSAPPGFAARLSLRAAGDMSLSAGPSPRVAAASQGLFPGRRLVVLKQIHSRRVVRTRTGQDVLFAEADGLVSDNPRLVLGVSVADCMPIWLVDRARTAFGLLHSGWKGTGILAEAVAMLGREFGSRPADLSAFLGPAIGACCYAVDAGRAGLFAAEFGTQNVRKKDGRFHLDLAAANRGLLERIGISRYTCADSCTCCDARFGSYRREGKDGFTRMIALAGYKS